MSSANCIKDDYVRFDLSSHELSLQKRFDAAVVIYEDLLLSLSVAEIKALIAHSEYSKSVGVKAVIKGGRNGGLMYFRYLFFPGKFV